jgi:hypothetical protein
MNINALQQILKATDDTKKPYTLHVTLVGGSIRHGTVYQQSIEQGVLMLVHNTRHIIIAIEHIAAAEVVWS